VSSARVFDTSVFIQVIRGRLEDRTILDHAYPGQAYLCAVVAHELWAGTRDRADAESLGQLLRGFERLGDVLTPTYGDWTLAGRLLEQYQHRFGKLTPSEHAHDVLIVLCASQVGGTVITANPRHMERWARWARRAGRQVRVKGIC